MSDSFNSQSKSIGELLGPNSRAKLVVPLFQRGYSWEKKHVDTFWNDVQAFLRESSVSGGPERYFLGPIVVLHKTKEETELLDGQQRMATATILLCAIRDYCRTLGIQAGSDFARDVQTQFIVKPDGTTYSLVLGELDETIFVESVQSDPPKPYKAVVRSHKNIQAAGAFLKAAVQGYVSGLSASEAVTRLKVLVQALRSDFVVASIPVDDERDAFRIFETLNDRGLRLSVPDLLLNYLMRKAEERQRPQVRALWTDMVEQMGRRDINRFMRHMWISKYGDLKTTDLFSALKDHIEKNQIDSLEFTRDCSTECESYVALLDGDESVVPTSAQPVIKTIVRSLDYPAAMPLLLSASIYMDKKGFESVARWLLVFLVRYSIIANLNTSGMETILYRLARDLRTAMQGSPASQGACLATIKRALSDNSPSDEQVQAVMISLTLNREAAIYIIGKLASRMQSATKEVTLQEANLEHIYPRNPRSTEWGGPESQQELDQLVWHIGNLIMLGERLNHGAANNEYAVKREIYSKQSELEIAKQVAATYPTWGLAEILSRASTLAPLVNQVWNFDNPSRV